MKRHIMASEVREGMEIEWRSRGWYHLGVVSTVVRNDHAGVWVQSSDGFEMSVEPDQVFTVLSESQPEEPTAFGACVEVAGVKYVRNNAEDQGEWEVVWFSEYRLDGRWANTWEQICERGPVTVINPDPFASTGQREPRVWDRWEDVPDHVTVSLTGIETPYHKAGGRIECKPEKAWEPALAGEHVLNKFSPFTEMLDAL